MELGGLDQQSSSPPGNDHGVLLLRSPPYLLHHQYIESALDRTGTNVVSQRRADGVEIQIIQRRNPFLAVSSDAMLRSAVGKAYFEGTIDRL